MKYHGTAQTGGGCLNPLFTHLGRVIMLSDDSMIIHHIDNLAVVHNALFGDGSLSDDAYPTEISTVDAAYIGEKSVWTFDGFLFVFGSGEVEVYKGGALVFYRTASFTHGDQVSSPLNIS